MDYDALFNSAIYTVGTGIKVFAGTTDDPFWIDLGGAFDTLNLRSTVAPGVLTPAQDAAFAELRVRHGLRLRGELDRDRSADLDADAKRRHRARDIDGGHDRHVGHDVAAADDRAPLAAAALRAPASFIRFSGSAIR